MKLTASVFAVAVLSGCAAPASPNAARPSTPSRDCFNAAMVRGYSQIDRDTIHLNAGPSKVYEIDIAGALCDDIAWTHQIALETPLSWVCVGDGPGQAEIHFQDPAQNRAATCYVREVRRVPE